MKAQSTLVFLRFHNVTQSKSQHPRNTIYFFVNPKVKRIQLQVKRTNFLIIIVLFSGLFMGLLSGFFFAVTFDLPQITQLDSFKPAAITRIYSVEKKLIAELYKEKRDPIPLSKMPNFLIKGLIATEDRNFYKHCGVDIKGISRAIIKDIIAGKFVEGASTITQQLSKTLFLSSKKTIIRKIREAILALQLERRYTKNELLAIYLNQVYFGSGAYGVKSAAKIFFGKSTDQLTLSECALIAGMPKAPSRYSPLVNPKRSIKRRNLVLKQMFKTGIISKNDYKNACKEKLVLANRSNRQVKAPYFIDYIKTTLEEIVGSTALYQQGLTVYTTLSLDMQQTADIAINKGLDQLDKRMKKKAIKSAGAQGALISIDIKTGGIIAMTGGKNYSKSSYNRATTAKRQPGSTFKAFIFALAIERNFPQNSLLLDAPISFKMYGKKNWRPKNFSNNYKGEMTFRKALALSKNIPAVRLIEILGPASLVKFAHSLGIKSHLNANLSLALGTSEVTLLELTAAYAVFGRKGEYIEPFGITEIIASNGQTIWRVKPRKKIVMSRPGAAIITNMLQAVISEGTGRKAKILNKPSAGKTGTTDNYKDALFLGFSPEIATGVWVGLDNNKTLGRWETGAKAALPIWIDFMAKYFTDKSSFGSYQYFDIPDEIVQIAINSTTGLPVTKNEKTRNAVTAFFRKGNEPH
ncbi:MAG: hypothetical protein B6I31_01560 [Desulfobacteraceae bacterium 4572_19]|nr:MAG: hypothetical protein B6I31_01560 [Desulfobacteraceae bacterium 4572_19]